MGDRYTVDECRAMLAELVHQFDTGMRACLRAADAIPDKPYAAMLSATYSIGTGDFFGFTMARRLNARDIRGACDALLAENKACGQVVKDLTNRRQNERHVCLEGLV